MSEINNIQELKTAQLKKVERRLNAIGWGLFFIWIGVAFLANVGWGAGLLGIGIIILGGQVTRTYSGLKLEGFGVVVGSLFSLGGVWELLNIRFDLTPIICIIAGLALLGSVLVGKARNHKGEQTSLT